MVFNPQRQQKLQQLTEQIKEYEKKIASTAKLLKQANSGRQQSVSTVNFQIETIIEKK